MLKLEGMFIQCLNLIPFRQTFLSGVIRFRNLSIINKTWTLSITIKIFIFNIKCKSLNAPT